MAPLHARPIQQQRSTDTARPAVRRHSTRSCSELAQPCPAGSRPSSTQQAAGSSAPVLAVGSRHAIGALHARPHHAAAVRGHAVRPLTDQHARSGRRAHPCLAGGRWPARRPLLRRNRHVSKLDLRDGRWEWCAGRELSNMQIAGGPAVSRATAGPRQPISWPSLSWPGLPAQAGCLPPAASAASRHNGGSSPAAACWAGGHAQAAAACWACGWPGCGLARARG